jgi:hypothetical protein
MEKNEELEYTCSECNSIINENDVVCSNCGADLSEIVNSAKYDKPLHRAIFYFIVIPLLFIVSFLISYFSYELSEYLNLYHLRISETITMYLPIIASSFLFAFFFLEKNKISKIILGSSLALLIIIIYRFLNTSFGILFPIVSSFAFFAEVMLYILGKKNYKILFTSVLIFIVWFFAIRV